jgi:site-specific recombinase XerD
MTVNESKRTSFREEPEGQGPSGRRHTQMSKCVTESRAVARLDAEAEAREQGAAPGAVRVGGRSARTRQPANRRITATIACAIDGYLLDHEGGNHSPKSLEWHRTALGLMRSYFEKERGIRQVGEVEAADINAWFAHMRKTPASRGKVRGERTIQTYARSALAFFHWLVRRETIERNPFDRVTFPKVGKPRIQTIDAHKFERLLLACAPPQETGPMAERAAVRNRDILWVLYDTGIRVSELCGLRLSDFDRKHRILTVKGKGSKERRIAAGNNCLRNLLYYLDKHRPDEEELAEWGSTGEDHLFLS